MEQVSVEEPIDTIRYLQSFGVKFKIRTPYLFVGNLTSSSGWILHVSAIFSEYRNVIREVIPFLLARDIAFKIIINDSFADDILTGVLGYKHLGKLISIYPDSNDSAVVLAKELVLISGKFKGPSIPTDYYLGGTVYTRYGSFTSSIVNPINGMQEDSIYLLNGRPIKDSKPIPFELPKNVPWPFDEIKPYKKRSSKSIFNKKYIPLSVLKPDLRGRVIKALKLGKWWKFDIDYCVLKEGKAFTASDKLGRSIADRIKWQYEQQKLLMQTGFVPAVYELFSKSSDTYLSMQYIDGISLQQHVSGLFNGSSWTSKEQSVQLMLIGYIEQVLEIVKSFHALGVIHRDLNPENFLIDKHDKLWCIDLEISYNLNSEVLQIPFEGGTHGFMGKEQLEKKIATPMEDIYAVGCLMIAVFAGLPPTHFNISNKEELKESLFFFINDQDITEIIVQCLNDLPKERPDVLLIRDAVESFKNRVTTKEKRLQLFYYSKYDRIDVSNVINGALTMLDSATFTNTQGIWLSKSNSLDKVIDNDEDVLCPKIGLYSGITGIITTLVIAKAAGFDLSFLKEKVSKNLEYLKHIFKGHKNSLEDGLFEGKAGLAVAIASCMSNHIIPFTDENIEFIGECLTNKLEGFDLSRGVSGQGIAILMAFDYLKPDEANLQLAEIINKLLSGQKPDGSWIFQSFSKHPVKYSGLASGCAGTTLFLLEYYNKYHDEVVESSVMKALAWLECCAIRNNDTIVWKAYPNSKTIDSSFNDGGLGIVLVFLKAYQILKKQKYKEIAEMSLQSFAEMPISVDLSLSYGLTGLGAVYLEAYKILGNNNWLKRASWIIEHITHNKLSLGEDKYYWLTDTSIRAVPDYFLGNCGITGLLMQYAHPNLKSIPFII